MNYIIFDLEYNQIDGRNGRLSKTMNTNRPVDFVKEILQIGAIKVDENLKYISNYKTYIKPKFLPTINKKVLDLINISPRYININGMYFDKAFNEFLKFIGEDDTTFITWSGGDINIFQKNLDVWEIDYNIAQSNHIDLQKIIVNKNNLSNSPSLISVASEYGIDVENIKLHDAYSDASITKQILLKVGLDNINKYKYKVNFKEARFIDNPFLEEELSKTRLNCCMCGRFIKTIDKTNLYKYKKNKFKINMLCYCNNCDRYIQRNYIYQSKFESLFIGDRVIGKEYEYQVDNILKRFNNLRAIEKEQVHMD